MLKKTVLKLAICIQVWCRSSPLQRNASGWRLWLPFSSQQTADS